MSHGDLRGVSETIGRPSAPCSRNSVQQNIIITSKGVPLISDYGLARFQHNVQRSSTFHRDGKSVRYVGLLGLHDGARLIESSPLSWMAPEISEDPESSNVLVR